MRWSFVRSFESHPWKPERQTGSNGGRMRTNSTSSSRQAREIKPNQMNQARIRRMSCFLPFGPGRCSFSVRAWHSITRGSKNNSPWRQTDFQDRFGVTSTSPIPFSPFPSCFPLVQIGTNSKNEREDMFSSSLHGCYCDDGFQVLQKSFSAQKCSALKWVKTPKKRQKEGFLDTIEVSRQGCTSHLCPLDISCSSVSCIQFYSNAPTRPKMRNSSRELWLSPGSQIYKVPVILVTSLGMSPGPMIGISLLSIPRWESQLQDRLPKMGKIGAVDVYIEWCTFHRKLYFNLTSWQVRGVREPSKFTGSFPSPPPQTCTQPTNQPVGIRFYRLVAGKNPIGSGPET